MAVTTTAHLRLAIIEALTTDRTGEAGTVGARALPPDKLFQRGYPPGFDPTIRSTRARDKPGAFVVVARIRPEAGIADELGSDHLYTFQVVISRDYFLGVEFRYQDVDDTMTRVADDLLRMRAALSVPGALDATAAGDSTGIAGAALEPIGDQSVLTVDQLGNGRSRLLNARDAFTCKLLYQP